MTGEAHWLTLILLAVGALGVVALFYFGARLDWRFRLTRRKFECPVHHQGVDATLIRDEKTGEMTSVQSCSHFVKPGAVTCEQGCLRTLNDAAGQPRSPPAAKPLIASAKART